MANDDAEWSMKWIKSDKSFAHRLVAFACVEGIFFSGAFASIYWIKTYKIINNNDKSRPFMNGLVTSNKFIARDEGWHCLFACEVYRLLNNKLSQSDIYAIVMESVDIAKEFIKEAIPVRLIGMSEESMSLYIEYTANRLVTMLGCKKIYNANNPFKFMEKIDLQDKTNFFESFSCEYSAHLDHDSGSKQNNQNTNINSKLNMSRDDDF